jgi:hypothetical protein
MEPDSIRDDNIIMEYHLQPHKLGQSSQWHYQLWENKKYEFGVASNGMPSIKKPISRLSAGYSS